MYNLDIGKSGQYHMLFKAKVEEELNCLVTEGTLEAVQLSEWASPIIPVLKPDKKSVRICEQTVNPVAISWTRTPL